MRNDIVFPVSARGDRAASPGVPLPPGSGSVCRDFGPHRRSVAGCVRSHDQ